MEAPCHPSCGATISWVRKKGWHTRNEHHNLRYVRSLTQTNIKFLKRKLRVVGESTQGGACPPYFIWRRQAGNGLPWPGVTLLRSGHLVATEPNFAHLHECDRGEAAEDDEEPV